ncbi:glycosyltransferase [Burkholderia sp. Bp9031]|uniref:glycosyltransferase family 4 protein n=1 Tax=Burkholderia sp. Bp9031 TaxID=2184566 RepID=UPI000F5E1B7A|nr:glycosyltransferase family 4 protein [Burkholderia sp. Bp9031]RQZ09493.1 glycosyltransferase [Burkholderia sp. Bp9031]
MKVSVAVCGRFHFHNYIDRLDELEILDTFYYSHRARTTPFSLAHGRAVNIWAKEYAVRAHSKLLKSRLSDRLFPIYHDLWQFGVRFNWRPTPLLHVMAHGTARHIVAKAKREGSIVLGEVVNTHPLYRDRLLSEEENRRGLPHGHRINRQQQRLIDEVNLYDYILAPSSIVRESFIQHGVPASIIKVIPYAANVQRFRPLERRGTNPNRFGILCVGQICLRKGQIYLLEAVKQLGDARVHVTLIGQIDPTIEPLLAPYRHLFTHIPRVDNAQLNDYYNAADLFVLPSLEEGLAVVLCEALATGLPIVATRESGAAEIIEHDRSGKIVPSGSVDQLANAIGEMIGSPDKIVEFSRQASIAAASTHNWIQYVDKLHQVYVDCLR